MSGTAFVHRLQALHLLQMVISAFTPFPLLEVWKPPPPKAAPAEGPEAEPPPAPKGPEAEPKAEPKPALAEGPGDAPKPPGAELPPKPK